MPFSWHVYLSETGAEISPSKLFHHVTKSLETLIKPGGVLEVNSKCISDSASSRVTSGSWWPAEVIIISGHLVLLKWCVPKSVASSNTTTEISEDSNMQTQDLDSPSFWFDLKSSKWQYIRPLGWCYGKNIPWSPPLQVSQQVSENNWQSSEWACNLQSAAITPLFFERRCLYAYEAIRVGGYFECEHELDPSCVWPAKVIINVGGRVLMSWFGIDCKIQDAEIGARKPSHFSLFYLHRRIHPLGYGKLYGLKYYPPPGYIFDRAISNIDAFIRGACPATYNEQNKSDLEFYKSLFSFHTCDPPLHEFKVGWKLEAVNPVKPYVVQPATVIKIFNTRYFLAELDSLEEEVDELCTYGISETNNPSPPSSCKIQFVGYAGMPEIMPVNDSQLKGIHLSPPLGWSSNRSFTWTNYLTYLSACSSQQVRKSVSSHRISHPTNNSLSPEEQNHNSSSAFVTVNCNTHVKESSFPTVNVYSSEDVTQTASCSIPFCPSESLFKGVSVSDSFQKNNSCGQSNLYSVNSMADTTKIWQHKEVEYGARTDRSCNSSFRFLLGMKLEMIPPKIMLEGIHLESEIEPPLCTATVTRVDHPYLLWILPDLPNQNKGSVHKCKPVMMDARSTDLYPAGWAESVGYPIIPPSGYVENTEFVPHADHKESIPSLDACSDNTCTDFSKTEEVSVDVKLRPIHELQYYTINYKTEEMCPPIFINSRCYLGPFLCKSNLEALPQRFGPGSVSRVMQNLITRLVRAAYKPLRVLRMFEADWASGIATAIENVTNAERHQRVKSATTESTNHAKSLVNSLFSLEQAEKEVLEQRRSGMRVVLISARCPRRGIKIEVPVEVCYRTRAVEEFCRQISLIFEACPHLLTLVPPIPIETESPLSFNLCGLNCTNSSLDFKKDIEPSQFPFETSPLYDCPSFCVSRLRSRYLDRLPGWKKRMMASLRPFGVGESTSNDINLVSRNNYAPSNGHRTRSAVAAAQRNQEFGKKFDSCNTFQVNTHNCVTTNMNNSPTSKSRKRQVSDIGSGGGRINSRLHRNTTRRFTANHLLNQSNTNCKSSSTGRGRPKRSIESVSTEHTGKKICNTTDHDASSQSRSPTNHFTAQNVLTTMDKKLSCNAQETSLSNYYPPWQTHHIPITSCNTLPYNPHSGHEFCVRNGVDAIRHTIAQLPLSSDSNLNTLFGNIPRVILTSNPMFWTPVDLASYLGSTDCREMWPWLAAEAVDGQAFMLLTLPVLHCLVGLRWEDAVRLARHVISVKQAFVEQFGMTSHITDNTRSTKAR